MIGWVVTDADRPPADQAEKLQQVANDSIELKRSPTGMLIRKLKDPGSEVVQASLLVLVSVEMLASTAAAGQVAQLTREQDISLAFVEEGGVVEDETTHRVVEAVADMAREEITATRERHQTSTDGEWVTDPIDQDGDGTELMPPAEIVGEPHRGRPPLGFDMVEGQLQAAENYTQVCNVLQLLDDEMVSKRAAAEKLDTTRATLNTCLEESERREMYHLAP